MTPVAVLAMVENGNPPRKPLHPFFMPNRQSAPTTSTETPTVPDQPDVTEDSYMSIDEPAEPKVEHDTLEKAAGRRSKRRKVSPELEDDQESKKPKTRKRTKPIVGPGIANHFIRLGKTKDDDAGQEERDITTTQQEEEPQLQDAELPQQDTIGMEGHVQVENTIPAPAHDVGGIIRNLVDVNIRSSPPPPAVNVEPPKPTKLLRFNPKTGTIGSPPKPKQPEPPEETPTTTKRRVQPSRARKPESKLVTIKYSSESDEETRTRVGEKIEAILKAPKQPQTANQGNKKSAETKKPPASKPADSKSTHPFFSGKAKGPSAAPPAAEPKNDKPSEPSQKVFMSTPCSPKKPRAPAFTGRMPQFGFNKNAPLKFPGAKPPAWPWKDMVHVRGAEDVSMLQDIQLPFPSRKSKGQSVKVDQGESIVNLVGTSIGIGSVKQALRDFNTDDFIPAPPELRLPIKHFESGRKLQQRILPELKTFKTTTKASGQLKAPPQLARLYDSVSSSLSAFDQCQCETSNWAQKYAPVNAYEVLQPGNEAFLLRDWLHALKVQSVETGSNDSDKQKKGKAVGPGRRKRRKKLDDFIVYSDDEFALDSDSDDGVDWAPSGFRGITRKTVVKSIDLSEKDASKIANTLILSGPHGCGKTAAVYAVAKELDFEVFEINSSSRRSGKDVLEKIGDMTRNHLVQQHQSSSDKAGDDQEEDATAEEVKSGKQATMNAFFRPKTTAAKPKQPIKPPPTSAPKEAKKDGGKAQRQSLILLEEVDILYEEDKQFWSTIVTLIAQAKRPFVMTCNDETLVPLHTLKLHGIFRLRPPPTELAVDRLLLVAANEGHALTRQAVASLYESRGHDLRAATTDLQYWCQIGVGDRKGGFDWYYPRWPRGCDLDENGDVVRVVSQSTYLTGMNWLGRDTVVSKATDGRQVEEDILEQAWNSWGLDMGSWQDSVGLESWAEGMPSSGAGKLEALEAFEELAEALSAADLCSSRSFGTLNEEPLDATIPELPAKARDDFVLGLTPLDSPLLTLHDSLTTALPSTIKSLSRSVLRSRTSSLTQQATLTDTLEPLDESSALSLITKSFTTLSLSSPEQPAIKRIDLAFAFDPIATSDSSASTTSYLDPSVFDRTTSLITLDVAPYVRSIVAYESSLQRRRLKMSSLLSVSEGVGVGVGTNNVDGGGTGTKRMRTTRAALSALEGGERSVKRKERWFRGELNPFLVEKTGGRGWADFTLQYLADNAVVAGHGHGQEEDMMMMKMAGTGAGESVSEAGASEVSVPWERETQAQQQQQQQQQEVMSDVNGAPVPVQQLEVLVKAKPKPKPKRGRPRKNMAKVVEVVDDSEADLVQYEHEPGEMAGVVDGDGKQEGVDELVHVGNAEVAGTGTGTGEAPLGEGSGEAAMSQKHQGQSDADADGDISMTQ